MRFDSLIFDVDGTLWDVTGDVAEGYTEGSRLSPFGPRTFTGADVRAQLGKPLKAIFEDLYPELVNIREDASRTDEERREADRTIDNILHESLKKEYEVLRLGKLTPYSGVIGTLNVLKERLPLFIVSNCEKGYIELFLEKTGTKEIFSGHMCYGDTFCEKDVTLGTLALKYRLEHACYVGDILNDAVCSKKAGMDFIWASYGFGTVPKELYYRKIDEFRELENIII